MKESKEVIIETARQFTKEFISKIETMPMRNTDRWMMLGISITFCLAVYLQKIPSEHREKALKVLFDEAKLFMTSLNEDNEKI